MVLLYGKHTLEAGVLNEAVFMVPAKKGVFCELAAQYVGDVRAVGFLQYILCHTCL